jgi:hypothetical protein
MQIFGYIRVLIQLTDSLKNLLKETANQLKGAARRRFQAQTVIGLLPTSETIRLKLNFLGYRLKRVAKVLPQKKFQKLMQSLSN